ncbi:MAG: flagellar protein FliT [Gammaproteobacteria bacterium]|nr:flagellar protein FliT [Gammaproteobacteria bacterium]
MVSSQPVQQNPQTDETVLLSARMEADAARGDWESVEAIATRLRSAVMQVPAEERRHAVLALQRSLENVRAQAMEARGEVTQKLSAIRRGKDATRAYSDTGGDDSTSRATGGDF